MKKYSLIIILVFGLALSGCSTSISKNVTDLMSHIKTKNIKTIDIFGVDRQDVSRKEAVIDFSLKLFNESFEEKNILISPLSIISALGMVSNGAKGNTLLEMEQVLNTDTQSLNDYLKAYREYLPSGKKYKVSLANSIWFKDDEGLNVNQDFLQTNKDYYNASIYKAPFDESTKNDINAWVKNKTNNIIHKLLEEAPSEETVMYLINALSFDAEWEVIYNESRIFEGDFVLENKEQQTVQFMTSNESLYIENEVVTGFSKPYKDGTYAFVALLPKVGVSMADLFKTIDAKELISLVENKQSAEVFAQIPKFSIEYNILLNKGLVNLGMQDAFDSQKADFTRLGDIAGENLFINRVIHKTKIDLDEKGTKAGAVTAIEVNTTSLPSKINEVILDRPFFYMIIDTEENLPLFMGALMNVN